MPLPPSKDPAWLDANRPDAIEHLHVLLLGRRGFPVASVKVPAFVLGDLESLLAQVREADPAAGYEAILRAALRLGVRQVQRNADRHARLSQWDRGDGVPR